MATVLGLNIKFAANTSGISKGAQQTASQLNRISKSAASATSALRGLVALEVGKIVASGFAAATNAISSYVSNIRASVDETAKLARQTGIAVEQLQVFQLAAEMSGVDNLVEPIRKLGIAIGQAAETGNIEKFERLGLNFDELSRMAPEDQFKAIAASIAALPTPAERAAAAVAIFGEQGVKMLPLFESNLAAVEERMKRLGIVLSEDQTGAIEEMNDALTMIQATFEGIIGQVTANLAPVITAMAEDFLSFVEGYQGLGDGTGGTALADSITEALFDGAEYLAGIFDYVVAQLSDWGVSFSGASETLAATFDIFGTAVAVMEAAFYFVRSVFNTFLAEASKWAASFVSLFSSATAEFLNNFSQEMDRRAEQDRRSAADASERAAGEGERATAGTGMASGWVAQGRERWEGRNSPEAQAEREAARAEREAQRQAAAEARKEAERQRKLEEAEKERIKKQEEFDKKLADMRQNLAIKEFQYAMKNAEDLAAVNQKSLQQSDIRSGGIAGVIAMATGREDPAVIEARKQLRELQALRASVDGLGNVVEIVGAA